MSNKFFNLTPNTPINNQEENDEENNEAERIYDQQPQILPTQKYREEGIVKYQLDVQEEINSFKERLLGGYYDKKERKFIKTGVKKAAENGADAILTMVLSSVGKNTSLSEADDKRLCQIRHELNERIINLIADCNHLNREQYGFNMAYKDVILTASKNFVEWSVNRARNGGTFRLINTNVNVHESNMNQNVEPKRSRFNGFFGGKNEY